MSARLSSSTQRLLVLALALVCAALLPYFSIRNAFAAHYADLQTLQGYERATRLEPADFRNWHLMGRYWQYNLEDSDTKRAIEAYTVSLSLNPRTADTWSDLGAAYEAEGNIAAARDAFLHAKSAYPLSAEISWQYGNFLLRQGGTDAAFLEMRHAVEAEPKRGAEALSRALIAEPNISLVIDRVLPPLPEAYTTAILDQVSEGRTVNAILIWNRLAALHPKLPLETYTYYLVTALLREKQVTAAWRVWKQFRLGASGRSTRRPVQSRYARKALWKPFPARAVQWKIQRRPQRSLRGSSRATFDVLQFFRLGANSIHNHRTRHPLPTARSGNAGPVACYHQRS